MQREIRLTLAGVALTALTLVQATAQKTIDGVNTARDAPSARATSRPCARPSVSDTSTEASFMLAQDPEGHLA